MQYEAGVKKIGSSWTILRPINKKVSKIGSVHQEPPCSGAGYRLHSSSMTDGCLFRLPINGMEDVGAGRGTLHLTTSVIHMCTEDGSSNTHTNTHARRHSDLVVHNRIHTNRVHGAAQIND